jgi:N-acetylglucosaminyldiphosphoundecaprenol N-acetyl-beta-D-mannosaminyltransferase
MDKVFTSDNNGLDYDLFDDDIVNISLDSRAIINTINQYSYCIAEEDPEFKSALKGSDILLPDGEGVVLAERFLSGKKLHKVSGTDIHISLLEKLNLVGGRCFYLGSSVDTLKKIEIRIKKEYPNIKVGYFSPVFKAAFTEAEQSEMIDAVNTFEPDVLFIGLTAPKQEKLSQLFKHRLNAKIVCAIGAVFDFYAGTIHRPNKVLIALKLEWLGRLITNPSKMWKRYLYYGPIYIYTILKLKLN